MQKVALKLRNYSVKFLHKQAYFSQFNYYLYFLPLFDRNHQHERLKPTILFHRFKINICTVQLYMHETKGTLQLIGGIMILTVK